MAHTTGNLLNAPACPCTPQRDTHTRVHDVDLKVAARAAAAACHLVSAAVDAKEDVGVGHGLKANLVVGRLAGAEVREVAHAAKVHLGRGGRGKGTDGDGKGR